MSIIAAFFDCSDKLRPHLHNYLESNQHEPNAQVVLGNLRKTAKYGGRKNVPSKHEILAITKGRLAKKQTFKLPGTAPVTLNIKSTTVVKDCIDQLCEKLDVSESHEREEFSIFYVIEKDKRYSPLENHGYIFDITKELDKNNQDFFLLFQRTSWNFELRLKEDNPYYIEVMYSQCVFDYCDGLLLETSESITSEKRKDIAKLAALQLLTSEKSFLESVNEVKFLVPSNALKWDDMNPDRWRKMINFYADEYALDPLQSKKIFLGKNRKKEIMFIFSY